MSPGTWTRVECACGKVAAIPEGGFFPLCGTCGRRMMAPIEGRVVYRVELVEHERFGPDPDVAYAGQGRAYSDEVLRGLWERQGWPTEPQDWPEQPSPDGIGTFRLPPWEVKS